MKKATFFNAVRRILTVVFPVGIAILVAVCIKNMPFGVTYSSIAKEAATRRALAPAYSNQYDDMTGSDINDIMLLEFKDYVIRSSNAGIYVFGENNEPLYKVKAQLSQFPEADASALKEGVKAHGKDELLELIAYMES